MLCMKRSYWVYTTKPARESCPTDIVMLSRWKKTNFYLIRQLYLLFSGDYWFGLVFRSNKISYWRLKVLILWAVVNVRWSTVWSPLHPTDRKTWRQLALRKARWRRRRRRRWQQCIDRGWEPEQTDWRRPVQSTSLTPATLSVRQPTVHYVRLRTVNHAVDS